MDPALPEALDFQRFASQRKIHPTISPKGTVTDLESLNPLGDFFGPKFGVCSQFAFFWGEFFWAETMACQPMAAVISPGSHVSI